MNEMLRSRAVSTKPSVSCRVSKAEYSACTASIFATGTNGKHNTYYGHSFYYTYSRVLCAVSLRNTQKDQCTSSSPVYAVSQGQESILLEACLNVVISIIPEYFIVLPYLGPFGEDSISRV